MLFRNSFLAAGAVCVLLLSAVRLPAQEARPETDPLSRRAFSDLRLRPAPAVQPLEAARPSLGTDVQGGWAGFQAASSVRWQAYVDRRTGHLASAVGGGISWMPWISGSKTLTGPAISGSDLAGLEAVARAALPGLAPVLGVDPASLALNRGRSGRQAGHLWYVDFDVRRGGLTVEGARVVFRVSHGNLIEIGAESLPSPGAAVPVAQVSREQALTAVADFVGGLSAADSLADGGSLHLLPVNLADPGFAEGFEPGNGRGLALVWQVVFHRRGVMGTWRARVDAVSGQVLELLDDNEYGQVTGGVFPVSPTATPETELPMPFADIVSGTGSGATDSAGFYPGLGPVTTKLDGPYVTIADSCGPIAKSSDWAGNVDFGTSGGTDCVTPGSGLHGDTHAARTQFYQVNRIKQVGRAWLPGNAWLQSKLPVNVNINLTCNAYWDNAAGSLNFFRSGGGCSNTGEIAAVALHEYGHGLDQNDGNGTSPDNGTGETYGDFTSALMTHSSCIGPGFRASNCNGYSNGCTSCTGVRDIDSTQHVFAAPVTVASFTQTHCPSKPSYPGPCGMEGHCESYVSSEALWDFAARDLPNPGSAAAWTVAERLWYLSRATATAAFTCTKTSPAWSSDGCATGSLWRTLRAADDDDGNLTNGTPHSCQLFAAFDRHGLACPSDPGASVCFAGCTPPAVPAALSLDTSVPGQVQASWSEVGGGAVYDLYRSELGCGSGFVRIADSLAGTSYVDTSVAGGLSYSYQVIAHPASGTACAAAPTACQSATPAVPACSPPAPPAGLTVTAFSISRIGLSWTPSAGASGYNVYRAAALSGPYTLVGTVTTSTFSDSGLTGSTPYFYKVRSFANACESGDSLFATAATTTCKPVSLYKTTFETGSGLGGWSTQILAGGSTGNDWRGIQACSPARSGSNVFRFGGTNCTGTYGTGEAAVAAPPPVTIPAAMSNARLSFWHRRDFEPGYDGGRVAAAVDGGNQLYFGPDSALSGEVYDNVIAQGKGTCPPGTLGGTSVFSGTKASLVNTVVDLDAICNAGLQGTGGCSGHSVQPGFLAISDCAIGAGGWYLDDVEVTACQPLSPLDFYTLAPCRLIDTRGPAGPLGGPALPAGGSRTFTVAGACGIPAGAQSLSVNLTVVTSSSAGYLQVYPGGSPAPATSMINFAAGATLANNGLVTLALDGSGTITVKSGAGAPVDFVVDVSGYYQ
jgi:hypothetical protein